MATARCCCLTGMIDLRTEIAREAFEIGFSDVGFTRPEAIAEAGLNLHRWIAAGHHGEMVWMADRLHWRSDPATLWPKARSVIMLAETYGPDRDPLEALTHRDRAAISVYAKRKDYHDVVKKRLKRLGRRLIDTAGSEGAPPEIKVFVDTAPVMEKPLAAAAGLGWQGKHTNLVSRKLGSWFFLGAIFTTLDLFPAEPHEDHCGQCRRCLDICPTAAFPAPYQLDARRCISYLTIELKGPIPRDLRPAIGNRIYGCDDCLAVCPWNKFAQAGAEAYASRPETDAPALQELLLLDDTGFRERYRGSPIKRIGRNRFLRNVLIAAGNSNDRTLIPSVRTLLSDQDPLVRGAAVWAFGRLAPRAEFEAAYLKDPDPTVAEEWSLTQQTLA
ncbi:MAG: tRNA epoxyqueuosine(34) reductase QueG [Pseudomonadota bacterium]